VNVCVSGRSCDLNHKIGVEESFFKFLQMSFSFSWQKYLNKFGTMRTWYTVLHRDCIWFRGGFKVRRKPVEDE